MAKVKNRDGTTTTYPDRQPDGSYSSTAPAGPGWAVGPTVGWDGEVGTGAVHTDWRDNIVPIGVGSIFAYGAFGPGGYALPGGGASSAAGAAGTGSHAGMTAQQMYDAGMFAGPSATAGANMAGTLGTSATTSAAVTQALQKAGVSQPVIQHLLSDPKTYAGLAALIPTMAGGGNSPFGGDTSGLMDEARKSLELQRHRVEQAQPVYDTLVNMSYGMSPKQYRGPAPQGYTPNPAPEGAYEMRAPQFGRTNG